MIRADLLPPRQRRRPPRRETYPDAGPDSLAPQGLRVQPSRSRCGWTARGASAALLAALLAGCVSTGNRPITAPASLEVPETWSVTVEADEGDARWWTRFGDPRLDETVERALRGNFDMQGAWARLRQARAIREGAASGQWPTLDANASVARAHQPTPIPRDEESNTVWGLSLQSAWEVDLWGRVSAGVDAAELDVAAARDDAEALAMTLTADVVDAWVDVAYQRERQRLLDAQVAIAETWLELVLLRFGTGQATALEILQQRQQVESLRSQAELVPAAEAIARNRLAALLGVAPGSVAGPERAGLPEVPPLPATGVPADVFDRRPDVRAARRRAEAADQRVVQAIAARLPTLRLTGSLGWQSTSLSDLFEDMIWNAALGLAAPLWDGGRRSAEVDRAEAVVDERVAAYGRALLVALREVEDALVRERQQRAYLDRLGQEVETARAALELAREQYGNGVVDYLRVLNALQNLQRLEQTTLDARRQLLGWRISLHRAMGGGWTAELVESSPRNESK